MISGNSSAWAAVALLVLPAAIIAAAELDERLRQRESPLRGAVLILRNWTLPFLAIWMFITPVLGVDSNSTGPRLAASALLLSLAVAVLRVLGVVIGGIRRRSHAEDRLRVPELLLAIPRLGIIIVTAWVLVSTIWGVDLSAALTALGVTSLVISFALQDTLSGLASGVLLLSDQPFTPGDWISVGDIEGQVVDINWRTSRIRDRNGDMIIVPNSELAGSSVINFTSPDALHRVVVSLQVAYLNPPTLAKDMLLDAARGTPGVLAEPPPVVRVVQIDDPLMGYEVDMWIDDYLIAPRVKSDFGALVWYQSHRHEVPLPSPAQDLYLYDGVVNAAAGTPGPGELRQGLQRSPLVSTLPDADIDRFAHSARLVRFAVGEALDSNDGRDLLVIVDGRALLVLTEPGGFEVTVSDLGPGDIVGLTGTDLAEGGEVVVRAITDCDVVVVDGAIASEVGSRNTELAAALNRQSELRRRRVERIVEHRVDPPPEAQIEESGP